MTYDGRGRLTGLSSGHRYAINRAGQRVAKSGPDECEIGSGYFIRRPRVTRMTQQAT